MLANILARYWWTMLLRGLAWILFGIVVLAMPAISLLALTLAFGALSLIDGVSHVVSAIGGRNEHEHWWLLLVAGLAGIAIGLLTFVSPGLTALVLLFYIAGWAIATGIAQVVAAIRLRQEIEGEFWLALAGLVSVAFGVLLLLRPGAGALAVLGIIAAYAIVAGVALVALAFSARAFGKPVAEAV